MDYLLKSTRKRQLRMTSCCREGRCSRSAASHEGSTASTAAREATGRPARCSGDVGEGPPRRGPVPCRHQPCPALPLEALPAWRERGSCPVESGAWCWFPAAAAGVVGCGVTSRGSLLPECCRKLWGWWGDWNISPMRRGWGSWACSAWRREGWEGT